MAGGKNSILAPEVEETPRGPEEQALSLYGGKTATLGEGVLKESTDTLIKRGKYDPTGYRAGQNSQDHANKNKS